MVRFRSGLITERRSERTRRGNAIAWDSGVLILGHFYIWRAFRKVSLYFRLNKHIGLPTVMTPAENKQHTCSRLYHRARLYPVSPSISAPSTPLFHIPSYQFILSSTSYFSFDCIPFVYRILHLQISVLLNPQHRFLLSQLVALDELKWCSICGKPIKGKRTVNLSGGYCSECFQRRD